MEQQNTKPWPMAYLNLDQHYIRHFQSIPDLRRTPKYSLLLTEIHPEYL